MAIQLGVKYHLPTIYEPFRQPMNIFSIARYMLPMTRYPYSGGVVPCPVCGEHSFTSVSGIDRRLKRLPTVTCDRCGLFYTNPMPTESELGTYYEKYYRFDYQLAATKPKPKHIAKRQREALGRVQQLHDLLPEGARTLDFGAGSGEFMTLMLEKGFDAHGFEPGETYATHAIDQLGARMRQIGWQEADYGPEFDLVTSFHVFEHLSTPLPALQRIARWLKPGGKVYLEVPDMAEWFARKGFGSLHFAHVLGFTQGNLTLAAAKAGLRPLKVVSPTGIIFEQGPVEDEDIHAALGLTTARQLTAIGPASRYWTHQLSKVGLSGGAKA